jgi:hypothetical protein
MDVHPGLPVGIADERAATESNGAARTTPITVAALTILEPAGLRQTTPGLLHPFRERFAPREALPESFQVVRFYRAGARSTVA